MERSINTVFHGSGPGAISLCRLLRMLRSHSWACMGRVGGRGGGGVGRLDLSLTLLASDVWSFMLDSCLWAGRQGEVARGAPGGGGGGELLTLSLHLLASDVWSSMPNSSAAYGRPAQGSRQELHTVAVCSPHITSMLSTLLFRS